MNEKKYPDLAVAILAGGASSRFGADKALVRLSPGSPTLLETTAVVARSLSEQVIVVGHERYEALELDIPNIPDEVPGAGPLQGISTAMRHLDRPRVLVLGCDMPCLSLPLLRWMIERPSALDAVVPRTAGGHWQTLHAIYRRSMLPVVDDALARGKRSVRAVLDLVTVDEITEADCRAIDPQLDSFFSLNTPEDLERAARCVSLH